jgi:hypothetical protein
MASQTAKARELLITTTLSKSEIASACGIPYQYVWRTEKDLPRTRAEMQAEYVASGGTMVKGDEVSIPTLVSQVRHREELEVDSLRNLRNLIYRHGFRVGAIFETAGNNAVKGMELRRVVELMRQGFQEAGALEQLLAPQIEIVEALHEAEMVKPRRRDFADPQSEQLWRKLGVLESILSQVMSGLHYPHEGTNDAEVLEDRKRQLKDGLREILELL